MIPHHAHRRVSRHRVAGRRRLLLIIAAPLLVLLPLTAIASSHAAPSTASTTAASKHLIWSYRWNPPLSLLSNYRPCCASRAQFRVLPRSFNNLSSQGAIAKVRFRTRWVDVKALTDGPNIAQQGHFDQAAQFKLQIFHSRYPID